MLRCPRLHATGLCLLISHLVCAQPHHLTTLRFERISRPQGLSQDIVNAVGQDRQGFMWFGTEDGLNRYDGYTVRVYKHDPTDPYSLPGNDVHCIHESRQGRLWFGTSEGLCRYEPERDAFSTFHHDPNDPHSLSANAVYCITGDDPGHLWVGTSNGLNRLDEDSGTFIRYNRSDDSTSISDSVVHSLLYTRNGILWVGTGSGLCRYDERLDRFIRYPFPETRSGCSRIAQIAESPEGNLWVAATDLGIGLLDTHTNRLTLLPTHRTVVRASRSDMLATSVTNSVLDDGTGRVWIGHNSGLDIYTPASGAFQHVTPDPDDLTALAGRVSTIYRDHTGAVWCGTFQGGVNRCEPDRQQFAVLRKTPGGKDGLSDNYVAALQGDTSGEIWIGTPKGLDLFDPSTGSLTHFRHEPSNPRSLGSESVYAILLDGEHQLWIGGAGGMGWNLDLFDRTRRQFHHFPLANIRMLFDDGAGTLWVGRTGDLTIDDDIVRLDHRGNILSRDTIPGNVWVAFRDSRGFVWTGGQYCCLHRYDTRTSMFALFEAHPHEPAGLTSGAVRSILEDANGYLWMGTWGGGLNRYDPRTNTFMSFLEHDGLPNNFVKGILADAKGILWISTEQGITRFDPASFVFKNYGVEDGLPGERFLSGSCYRAADGWMYFGGTNGLTVFHPDSIRDNPHIPSVVITAVTVLDRSIRPAASHAVVQELSLNYDEDFVSFEFVALDYASRGKSTYSYRMEGLDRQWIMAGTRRYAAYTQLSPGEYTFRVRAANNDGVWNNDGAAFRLFIAPPFWQTWWFRLLVAVTAAAILILLYRYRMSQVLAVERLRARIADDLHDDVGTELSTIVLASQAIERKLSSSDAVVPDVRWIGAVALRTQEMMRDIVWLLHSRNDSLQDLVMKMRETAQRVLRGVRTTLNAPQQPSSLMIGLDFRRNVFLFYKECLHNIARHASASDVVIDVQIHAGVFSLSVRDNGAGFDTGHATTGSGLHSLRNRARELGGVFTIDSAPSRGTTVSLVIRNPQMRHGTRRFRVLSYGRHDPHG